MGGIERETLDEELPGFLTKGWLTITIEVYDERERRPRRRSKSLKDITHKVRNKSQTYMKGQKKKKKKNARK